MTVVGVLAAEPWFVTVTLPVTACPWDAVWLAGVKAVMLRLAGLSTVAEPEEPPAPIPSSIALSAPYPNPSRSATTLRFALPAPAVVDLAVYDVRGRRIESVIPGKLQDAGEHEVPLRTSGWPAGFYFCRLQIGETSIARKFVVLP